MHMWISQGYAFSGVEILCVEVKLYEDNSSEAGTLNIEKNTKKC